MSACRVVSCSLTCVGLGASSVVLADWTTVFVAIPAEVDNIRDQKAARDGCTQKMYVARIGASDADSVIRVWSSDKGRGWRTAGAIKISGTAGEDLYTIDRVHVTISIDF